MTNVMTNRIDRIQEAHPWLLEKEARLLLVVAYAAMTRADGLSGQALQQKLDAFTQMVVGDERRRVEIALKKISRVEADLNL